MENVFFFCVIEIKILNIFIWISRLRMLIVLLTFSFGTLYKTSNIFLKVETEALYIYFS
jgi:hypothetical protein